ncbi:MAG: ATP-dependent helicase, partial [Candidatus Hermodarchaeota archaeon]
MIYTKNQEEAINFKDGNLQIIACAGSGKTDVITRRIAILIKDGISPENILAFTFTEKAAEEMKLRTWQHLHGIMPNHPELGDMYVGTIHSFCFRLLQKYYPKYEAYDILDENKRNIFCYANFDKLKLSTFGKRTFEVVDKFSRSMDLVREELIDLEKLPYNFLDCYKAYLDLLNSEKFLDFSALMFETLKKLQEDSEFLDEVKNQYKYIIVDEYQDINKIQEYIIELIAGKNGNLCVVGDDDQCIYQWRGTDLKNILNFENRYENVKRIDNSINFRSSIAIVESAKNLIEGNSSRLEKKIEVWEGRKINYDEGDIYEVFFNNQNEEVEFIVDHIKHLVNTKFINNKGEIFTLSYQDIAIFFRSVKTSAEPYIKVFKKLQIPFIVKGGGKLFEQDEIKLIMYSLAYLGDIDYEKLEDSIKKCEKFYKQCFHGVGDVNKFITQLKDKKREISTVIFIRLQTLFSDLLNIIGAHEFELNETQFYNFGMFSQVISDFTAVYKRIKISQLIDFFAFIKGYGELNYEEGGLEDPTRINAVKIMTIHRAKGLQFPVIFIPNLVQGRFPSTAPSRGWYIPKNLFNFEKYEGTEEDERRLFYVAITRSEKYLFISASRRISGLSTNKRPSLFFRE